MATKQAPKKKVAAKTKPKAKPKKIIRPRGVSESDVDGGEIEGLRVPKIKKPIVLETMKPRTDRPDNLPRVVFPSGPCPLTFRGNMPDQITQWAEDLRDYYEKRGQFCTALALTRFARSIGGVGAEDQVKRIYAHELNEEGTDNKPPEKRHTFFISDSCRRLDTLVATNGVFVMSLKPGAQFTWPTLDGNEAGLVMVSNEFECRVRIIAGARAGAVLNVAPQTMVLSGYRAEFLPIRGLTPPPAKVPAVRESGAVPTRAKRGPSPSVPRDDPGKRHREPPKKLTNTTKLEVVWTMTNGKHRATVAKQPIRNLARWMGADGWTDDECFKAFTTLGLGDYPDLRFNVVNCHASAGRRAGHGGDTAYGVVPKLDDKTAKILRGLK